MSPPDGLAAAAGPSGAQGPRPLRDLLRAAAHLLDEAGVPSPEHDARELAAFVLGVPRLEPAMPPPMPPGFGTAYAEVVDRRRRREPLQHIVGSTGFRYLTLAVQPGVFVPRPETEAVAQVAVDEARRVTSTGRSPLVVDLCCGAGGIAISVDVEAPGSQVVALDLSPEAVALTRRNHAASSSSVMRIEQGDATSAGALADLDGTVDVVVTNPPYIPPDAVPNEPEVRDHDPDLALYGGGVDGLEVPRGVVVTAARLLVAGGLLVMEHAEVQAAGARELVKQTGAFGEIRTRRDLTGRDRMVVARRSGRDGVADSRP